MIRKSDYFEQTDRYLNKEMSQSEISEFEIQLENDSDLARELNLHLTVEQAVGEFDIISLRNNLNQIVQNQPDTENISVFDSFNFGLSEELSSYKNLNSEVKSEDIFNFGYTFPNIHLYQHKIAGKENIHQFYREQSSSGSSGEKESFTPYEEELFADIQKSLEENDIFDIRANLKHIAQSIPVNQFTTEEIDDYIYDEMDPTLRVQFEEELAHNTNLVHDLQLIKEIDLAASENEIMDLRASLNEIQKSAFHSSVKIKKIEGYIYGELSDDEMGSFENEISSSKDLFAEIDLIRNVDLALNENDVMQLRNNLQTIAKEVISERQTERSFAGKFKPRKIILSSVAASLILLLGITGLMSRQTTQDQLYQKYNTTYQTSGIVRSARLSKDQTLAMAMQKFDNQEYESALGLLEEVISRDQNNMVGHFYAGVSLQETGKYKNAIKEYETVIIDKDNLFIEQAEWYIGMCYLQTDESKKALKQFKKIAKNEGFYQQKAQAILRKMKTLEE
ncbi:MAG TPA: hypothetical protein VFC65_18350 [Prolixibacteraceae bacterium]|nr:hypothetical protein [Prolixibacteraceae bacterium]